MLFPLGYLGALGGHPPRPPKAYTMCIVAESSQIYAVSRPVSLCFTVKQGVFESRNALTKQYFEALIQTVSTPSTYPTILSSLRLKTILLFTIFTQTEKGVSCIRLPRLSRLARYTMLHNQHNDTTRLQ